MLRILGGPKRLCNGVTRRDLLAVGGLGLLGIGAPALVPSRAGGAQNSAHASANALPGFGSAKNVILLYLFGGPSHIEMLDVKPHAPVEVRGKFESIASSLEGLSVCEHLPRLAQVMDRATVVRSLNHPWNFHGMQYATTGLAVGSIPVEERLVHPDRQPFIGSVVHYHDQEARGPKSHGSVPDNIMLPFPLSSRRSEPPYAKPFAAYLGTGYDPIWTEFRGTATRSTVQRSFGPPTEFANPYLAVNPDCRFLIVPEADLPSDLPLDRLDRRRSLLEQIEVTRRQLDRHSERTPLDQKRELAFSLLDSRAIREAFALEGEPDGVRDAYGPTLFGQATLQARRLVEAGCRFVTVVWDEFGQLNSGWDTHVDHYNRLANELLPGLDRAFSSLILDLEQRGLLDETLVVVMNEMGRTPRFEGDGRGHWGRAYTNFFAGAGLKRGTVVGRTDAIGATVVDRPVSAKDILATIYHLVGINPDSTLDDRLGRPVPLVHDGQIVTEMLA
ncbi:MAG: DUF1501 domain-containing protein [Planctomycetaceae bacterium]|nr:DUF1501 domain-containing protein [Planctomycetaceae bacterium]